MARRTKIQRYDDILTFPNVTFYEHFLNGEFAGLRGNWSSVFPKNQPITVELACGKGDYVLGLGARYPDRNFIGIDIKGDRLWKGAQIALDAGLTNVHFIRAHIDHLCHFIGNDEIDEIWITFPDPYLRKTKKKKRLTHPVFLKRYFQIMKPDGIIHLKTDSDQLFSFTRNVINILNLQFVHEFADIYNLKHLPADLDIRTYYEKQHLQYGRTIKYLSFQLDSSVMHDSNDAFDHLP